MLGHAGSWSFPFQEPRYVPWPQRYNRRRLFWLIEQKQPLLNQSLPPQTIIASIFRLLHLQSMDELRQCLHTIAYRRIRSNMRGGTTC